jgi:molybdenum cofactor cytidylyltransferase
MEVEAVILAGGYSSRARAFKMELLLNGKAILQHVIEVFLPICKRIIVVCGYQQERVVALTEKYGEQVEVVYNEDYPKGMFSSVKKGIKQVNSPRFFLTPGDYPLISLQICKSLLEHRGDFVKPSYQHKGGHPILLPYSCIDEILGESDNSNLKDYLQRQIIHYVEVEEEGVLIDVDTREDLTHAMRIRQLRIGLEE